MNELKKLMEQKGYDIGTLARAVGCQRWTLSNILNKPKPRVNQTSTYFSIARVLETTEEEVRRISGNPLMKQHPLIRAISMKGLTVREFSIKTGVPYETLIGIISGRVKKPSMGTLYMLGDLLDVDPESLYRKE
ncbi:MAG: helix-turn-helix domain-containing protein [Lachnospiraceae bacterium]|nr:helix-turn-helix domain-containing protein [Lachnospiraceae bacterium]